MDGWAFAYLPDSFNLGSVRAIMPQGVLFRWKQSGQNLVNWQTHIPGTLGMINSGSLLLTMQRVCHRWHETKFPGRCPSHPPLQVCIEFPLSILCISSFFSRLFGGGHYSPGMDAMPWVVPSVSCVTAPYKVKERRRMYPTLGHQIIIWFTQREISHTFHVAQDPHGTRPPKIPRA